MKRYSLRAITLLLLAGTFLAAHAGKIVPTAMRELVYEMTAQYSDVVDAFKRPCALIKVNLPYEGAEFEVPVKVDPHAGVYYVWMEDGAKKLKVFFPNCVPVIVNFGDLMESSSVKAQHTYELDFDIDALEYVANPAAPHDLGKDYAIITLSPKPTGAALLMINGSNVSFDKQGQAIMLLPYGSHNFQIVADGFANYTGQVTVNKGGATNITVELKSTQGTLSINCATPGSTIIVQDDPKSSSGSWSGQLPAGSYKVEISKQGYHTVTQIAEIASGQECKLNIPALTPITGSLAVQIMPVGSTVKVDGKEMGTTPIVLRDLLIGSHKIEVTKPGYAPYTTTLTISEGPDNPALTATLSLSETSTKMPAKTPTDYTNLSLADLRSRAEAGDPEAQWRLGYKYAKGQGVDRDYSEAVKWYRKAAEQGDGIAQYLLGVMYENGWGVTEDNSEAEKWYKKALPLLREAAKQGNADAQFYLGVMYECGRGVTRDYSEAVKWYIKSAEQAYASAQSNLGAMYANGLGVTQDYSEAVKWFRKSAEQGNANAQYDLGRMYEHGNGVTKAVNEAVKWYRKAAAQGNQWAKDKLQELGY